MNIVTLLLLGLIASSVNCHDTKAPKEPQETAPGVFDVTKFGAKGDGSPNINEDGESDNSMAFIRAWRKACDSKGATTLIIPKGKFLIGPVLFGGPCKAIVTVEIQGTLLANPDVSLYPEPYFLMFENVDGVTVTGTGIVDGQGAINWKLNDCKTNPNCATLPTSIKFQTVRNSVIEGIESLNPMFFHIALTESHNVTVRNVKITAPPDSPSTNGLYMSRSDLVTVSNSVIGTGDDCISIGHGSRNVLVTGVTCGPGQGISVGNLGELDSEMEVNGVVIKNCKFIGTVNGARIKSLAGLKPNKASAITFEDLVMDHVQNPIVIDQQFGLKGKIEPSHVKISDVHFRNIRGTVTSKPFVNFACSQLFPCEGIEVADINLTFDAKSVVGNVVGAVAGQVEGAVAALATCSNAKVVFNGKHDGLLC